MRVRRRGSVAGGRTIAGTVATLLAVLAVLGGGVLSGPAAVADETTETAETTETTDGRAARDVHARPFAWDSPWNLPLARAAALERFDTRAQRVYLDIEDISVDPRFPVRDLDADGRSVRVHVDPDLTADGSWNHCSTFLVDAPDRRTVVQGQPLRLSRGGEPSYAYAWDPLSLTGPGLLGCHGGSNLSGIGGTVRVGEMSSPEPLRHALKISLNCELSCSRADGGFRWPASKADRGFEDVYRGSNPHVRMGSLMALPPSVDPERFRRPDVRKIAVALRDYGAYVVDKTGGPSTNSLSVQAGAEDELPGCAQTRWSGSSARCRW
ncbi:hypothetical protein [Actinomycetospora straminea]|uniref:Uncharacterized protein n=1 Tax=Actinomycetospora straminea TaxID=663607 RepID=A0ABP9DZS3_9PSEU|nr:hypothetical protein [Actinomycetospora straminea]MDD7931125.1 hypothetical protein [Actinomycetospora straminea]